MKNRLLLGAVAAGLLMTAAVRADDDRHERRYDRYAKHSHWDSRHSHGHGNRHHHVGQYCDDRRHSRARHYHVSHRDYYRHHVPRHYRHYGSGHIDGALVITLPLF